MMNLICKSQICLYNDETICQFFWVQGLVSVFDEMFDTVEHRLCLRHLYANFKKKFGGGSLIRDLMMGAAKATYILPGLGSKDG
jgi:hypothetical protein